MNTVKRSGLTALFLVSLLLNQPTFAQEKTSTEAYPITNEALKAYVGQYDPEESGPFFSITVSLDGEDRLMAQPTDGSQPLTLLEATAKDQFDLIGTNGLMIAFNRDENEKIVSLTFSQGSRSFTAKKVK